MEEGKLNAILSGFDNDFSKIKHQLGKKSKGDESKKPDPVDAVAKNVVQYIQMKEGGHFQYGVAFIVSQVK